MRDILRQTGVSDTAQRGVWQIACHYVNVFFFSHHTIKIHLHAVAAARVRAKHTGLCVFVVLSGLHVWIWGWCMAQPCLLPGCHPHLLFSRKMSFTISVTGTVFLPEMSPLGNSFVFIWLDVRGICLPDAAYMIDKAIYPNTGREASQTQTHTSTHFNACAHTHTHTFRDFFTHACRHNTLFLLLTWNHLRSRSTKMFCSLLFLPVCSLQLSHIRFKTAST